MRRKRLKKITCSSRSSGAPQKHLKTLICYKFLEDSETDRIFSIFLLPQSTIRGYHIYKEAVIYRRSQKIELKTIIFMNRVNVELKLTFGSECWQMSKTELKSNQLKRSTVKYKRNRTTNKKSIEDRDVPVNFYEHVMSMGGERWPKLPWNTHHATEKKILET